MRRMVLAGLAAWFCAVFGGPEPAVALELNAGAELDYTYTQDDLGGDVNATTQFNQKYEIKYSTSLTSAHDFLGAVRLDLQDAWYTDQASTSQVAPTLEMATKGSQLAARIAYEAVISSTDAYHETGDVTSYSDSLTFDLEMTPALWPEVKLKFQRRRDYEENASENATNTFEFQTRKDIYGVRLEFDFKREDTDDALPARTGSTATTWSAKATYKEILWGGTEFELAYEINENYADEQTRGVFSGETSAYTQSLKTRLKNSLVIGPRMTLGLAWEYQFDQDLLALDFDYKLKNKYVLDLRWDAFDWLKIASEARRETDLDCGGGRGRRRADEDRHAEGRFRPHFDFLVAGVRQGGVQERRQGRGRHGRLRGQDRGREVRTDRQEPLGRTSGISPWTPPPRTSTTTMCSRIARPRSRPTLRLKPFDLILTPGYFDLFVTPSYEVSRTNDWEPGFDFPTSQQQVRDAKIKFDYQFQLLDMFKATFSHEYGYKVDDTLDEVLNFERVTPVQRGHPPHHPPGRDCPRPAHRG